MLQEGRRKEEGLVFLEPKCLILTPNLDFKKNVMQWNLFPVDSINIQQRI